MPSPRIQVGQVWRNDNPWQRKREYYLITSIKDERRVWGFVRNAYASILRLDRQPPITEENVRFTELNEDYTSTSGLIGWTCLTNKGLTGLLKKLKRERDRIKKPPVYRKTLRKQYRDRLIAEALTGTKPIA